MKGSPSRFLPSRFPARYPPNPPPALGETPRESQKLYRQSVDRRWVLASRPIMPFNRRAATIKRTVETAAFQRRGAEPARSLVRNYRARAIARANHRADMAARPRNLINSSARTHRRPTLPFPDFPPPSLCACKGDTWMRVVPLAWGWFGLRAWNRECRCGTIGEPRVCGSSLELFSIQFRSDLGQTLARLPPSARCTFLALASYL
jgi:hypothetical protein